MVYYVQPGDTLWRIALRLNSTIERILQYNVICNPNLIFPGDLIYLPDDDNATRSGYSPYYVIRPYDTLWCLSNMFQINLEDLIYLNRDRIADPNIIYAGDELLILSPFFIYQNPDTLMYRMKSDALYRCQSLIENISDRVKFEGDYVIGWEAIGDKGIPYLLELLNDSCYAIRYFAIKSLGKIASRQPEVYRALESMTEDTNSLVAEVAINALKRIQLVETDGKKIHVVSENTTLLSEPLLESPVIRTIPSGTPFVGLKWLVPGRFLSYFDYIKILSTGETGFVFRPYSIQTYMI